MKDDGVLISRAWAEKVNAALFGTADASPAIARASRFYDVRPASLASSWTQNAAGVWTASAYFFINDKVDKSSSVPIYAPAAESKPYGSTGSRFYIVWRARWELVTEKATPGKNYEAGEGIGIHDGVISNDGVIKVKVENNSKYIENKELWFDPFYFAWGNNSSDIVGKKVISISVHYETVVTSVTLKSNGSLDVKTKNILCLGAN